VGTWVTLFSAVIGVLAGGTATYFTSRSQLRIEAEHAYDLALRNIRLEHYQTLFHLTRSIPRQWLTVEIPRRSTLVELRKQFHNWYFSDRASGMFLSQAAREAYFSLQNELQSIAAGMTGDAESIDEDESAALRLRASVLRHQLTADLGTAEAPRRLWLSPQSFPPPPLTEQGVRGR
jgi:hypothetical protein